MKPVTLLLLLALTAACQSLQQPSPKPEAPAVVVTTGPATAQQAANTFYREVRRERMEGLPSVAQLKRLRPYLSTDLAHGFEQASAKQKAYLRQHPEDKGPWVEGDLFSSLFEGVTAWKLGQVQVQGRKAEVPVHLSYREEKGKPVEWQDTLVLVQTPDGWRVDDIRMGGDWTFKAGGQSLRQTLSSEP